MTAMGYTEKGVYIPLEDPSKTVVFVPSQPLTRIPTAENLENLTFLENPKGLVILPPGLGLADLIRRQLGAQFKELGLEKLSIRLPRVLIEDLEIAQDFDMQVDRNFVRFKLRESVYSQLCSRLRESTKISSSLGCPICSAMACIIAQVSEKPVLFEENLFKEDGRTVVSSYRILEA
jgi:hypothetical protein